MKYLFYFFVCFGLIFAQAKSAKKSIFTEDEKIKFLFAEIEKSEGKITFIRNGDEFSALEASKHMKKKLDYAGKEIKTANQFIEKIATKSYMTGNIYMVKLADGQKIESAKWLREILKRVE
jgi:pimeloyl-CoA synthetase